MEPVNDASETNEVNTEAIDKEKIRKSVSDDYDHNKVKTETSKVKKNRSEKIDRRDRAVCGDNKIVNHGARGDNEIDNHGASDDNEIDNYGASGDNEIDNHGGSGDNEIDNHGGSGDNEIDNHGGSGDNEIEDDEVIGDGKVRHLGMAGNNTLAMRDHGAAGDSDKGTEREAAIDAEEEERRHFLKILAAFRNYKRDAMRRVSVNEACFQKLPKGHRKLLSDFLPHLNEVRTCVAHNDQVIEEIVREAACIFSNTSPYDNEDDVSCPFACVTNNDMDKVKSTLKQFVRDWSEDGWLERKECYAPVIEAVRRNFPKPSDAVKVLVPGAGLGRLAWELARMGFACQGNEWSLYMLIASNFVLNRCSVLNQYSLYPWAHQFCNNEHRRDQLMEIRFPDVNPQELPKNSDFSMAAGDFLEVYTEPASWDCVATVFFIDTAHNVVAYVETFWKILKPGGIWTNLGPLLYHYADIPGELSIELCYEDLRKVIEGVGFEFLAEQKRVSTHYTQNPHSMLQYVYNSVFFTVRKPLTAVS